jgi:Rod binding domain-containing protein
MAGLKPLGSLVQGQAINGADSLQNLKRAAEGKDSAKISKAAHDFESILIGQWLEQAEKSFATVPGSEADAQTDPGHDQLQSIAMQSLAHQLTKSGGLGIAALIIKQLQAGQTVNNKDSKAQ